jgi:hypothetical protein
VDAEVLEPPKPIGVAFTARYRYSIWMDVHASIFGRLRSTRDQRDRKESNLRRAGLEAAALPLSYRRKRWRGFRRSGKRSATTFPSRATGNRTRPAALKGRHPYPLEHGPMKYALTTLAFSR